MYSQSFTPRDLYFCTIQTERRNFGLSKDEFVQLIDSCIGNTINEGTFQFKIKIVRNYFINGQNKKSIEYLCQNLILRKLYNNIKRIYGVEQANRDQIVKQMILLLKEDMPKWIIRLDVHHFYESINYNRLIERFQEDGRLNSQSIRLLKTLFSNMPLSFENGLPRGLSISSVMSELYMKYFDLRIRRLEGVYYYARFVDDIVVFCSNEKTQENAWNFISESLAKMGLCMNTTKSYKWNSQQKTIKLNYLGYTFLPKDGKSGKNLDIIIESKKVNVIKTRITKSFVRFAKDGNFEMLKNRIKFLTGNFTLYNPSTLLPIKVGIYFNYNQVTENNVLYELDKYFQKILHCRNGKLGSILATRMTDWQRIELTKYSFVFGFKNHVNHFFTSKMLIDINNCWR